VFLIDLIL
jgi:hypothetical protein